MGQCISKSELKTTKSSAIKSGKVFDYAAQVKHAGIIHKDALQDIKNKDLREAHEKFRAFCGRREWSFDNLLDLWSNLAFLMDFYKKLSVN